MLKEQTVHARLFCVLFLILFFLTALSINSLWADPVAKSDTAFSAFSYSDVCVLHSARGRRVKAINEALEQAEQNERYRQKTPPPKKVPSFSFQLPSQTAAQTRPKLLSPATVQTTRPQYLSRDQAPPPAYSTTVARAFPAVRLKEPQIREDTRLERGNSDFVMGTELFGYAYREPSLMKQTGVMYGVHGTFTYRMKEHTTWDDLKNDKTILNVFKVSGRFSYGQLNYKSESTGKDEGIPNYSVEVRGLLGTDVPVNYASLERITPYFGLAYRYLLDDGGGRLTTTNSASYDRESQYCYVPFGMDALTKVKNWSIEANAEYDLFIYGVQKTHVADMAEHLSLWYYTGHPVVSNRQKHGFGLRGSVKAIYEKENFDFIVEPFVRYWSIEESERKTITHNGYTATWWEPDNNTVEWGFKLGLRY